MTRVNALFHINYMHIENTRTFSSRGNERFRNSGLPIDTKLIIAEPLPAEVESTVDSVQAALR